MVNLTTVQSGPYIQAQELNGAIERQPANASLYARRATFRLDAGQVEAALADINQALTLDDETGAFYFTKARALREQRQFAGALAAAAEASRHGFASPELNLLVGEANLATRHYQARPRPARPGAAAGARPCGGPVLQGISICRHRRHHPGLDYLRASLARDPRQAETLHQLAFLLNAYRQPEPAAAYAARGLRLAPTYAPLVYDYARQFELQARPDSALAYYAQALRLDSTLYRADYHLAQLASAQRRYALVVPALRRALRRAAGLPNARQLLAESLESLGRYAEAQAQYRQLAAENPGNRHWTYKAWKTGERSRGFSGDTVPRTRLPVIQALRLPSKTPPPQVARRCQIRRKLLTCGFCGGTFVAGLVPTNRLCMSRSGTTPPISKVGLIKMKAGS